MENDLCEYAIYYELIQNLEGAWKLDDLRDFSFKTSSKL